MKREKSQKGFVLWFTGLSGAGKSTLGDAVYKKLAEEGYEVERLDGDIVRKNLTKGLGFSKQDRTENIRRVAYVASLLSRHKVGVVASFISPYKKERDLVRRTSKNFCEIFISTPLSVCEKRDIKGMYKKARSGEIENFTGVSDPYEAPEKPELNICCLKDSDIPKEVNQILRFLRNKKYLQ